jgi:hypothetical protein
LYLVFGIWSVNQTKYISDQMYFLFIKVRFAYNHG